MNTKQALAVVSQVLTDLNAEKQKAHDDRLYDKRDQLGDQYYGAYRVLTALLNKADSERKIKND